MSGLISAMKERIKNSSQSSREILYIAADTKRRIRFLQELDDGYSYTKHESFEAGINSVCLSQFDMDCPLCEEKVEGVKEYTWYAWNVWDYESNSVKILLYKATGITPVPALIEFYEEYGTIMDRDYTIKKVGKGTSGNIAVIPGERSKFNAKKVKLYSESQMNKLMMKAYPVSGISDSVEDDAEEDIKPKKAKKKKSFRNILESLDLEYLIDICIELGMSKKEVRGLSEEEIIEVLYDDYDEEDIKEVYESLEEDEDDE